MRFSISILLSVAACLCAPLSATAQPTQAKLVGPLVVSNRMFGFNLYAPLGRMYEIDSSPDFKTWSAAAGGIVSDSVPFVDANSPGHPRLFYRAGINWTIQLANSFLIFITNSGIDGRLIAYPYNWSTNQGRDGRLIGYPPGWITNQGPDGRLIAYPSGWTNARGPDGRLVAFPTNGCTLVTNANGRLVVHPASGVPGAGTNSYQTASWTFVNGGDGRLVAVPLANFSTNKSGDGRLIAYPASGWSKTNGPDGRVVAYPTADFTTNLSLSGRIIAFPKSGWATAKGIDGRTMAYPATGVTTLELDFEDQQLFALIGHLRSVLAGPDFGNYIVYTFFGTGEQRFAD